MGDRCYMQLTCKAVDVAAFEALGFTSQDWDQLPGLALMVDHEANYAHVDEMPTDVIYEGFHNAGGCYCGNQFFSAGAGFHESACTEDGCLFVVVDDIDGHPDPKAIEAVQSFVGLRNVVKRRLTEYSAAFAESEGQADV